MDNKVKITIKLDKDVKIALDSYMKSNNTNINKYFNIYIENLLSGKGNSDGSKSGTDEKNATNYNINNIYNGSVPELMVNHFHTISCMEDSAIKSKLEKEMEEILCQIW